MAFVVKIEKDSHEFRSTHPTQVVCKYAIGERDGKRILQLNTYGSENRKFPDKLSQTLQFDESTALALAELIEKEFGGARR